MTHPLGEPPMERDEALCDELLAYLEEHPSAMDSLEGITEWWLPRHHIKVGVERVSRALEALAERNVLERIPDAGGVLYRLRRPTDARHDNGARHG